jgi:hypothetical protein
MELSNGVPKCDTCKYLCYPYEEGNVAWGKGEPCCRFHNGWWGGEITEAYCSAHKGKEGTT